MLKYTGALLRGKLFVTVVGSLSLGPNLQGEASTCRGDEGDNDDGMWMVMMLMVLVVVMV
jgi:hypothetical protein